MLCAVDNVIANLQYLMELDPEAIKALLTHEVRINATALDSDLVHPAIYARDRGVEPGVWVVSIHRLLHCLGINISPDAEEIFDERERAGRAAAAWLNMGVGDDDEEIDDEDLPETYIVGGDPDEEVA